ncbi:PH domain-containing protein [Streptomyces sp. NPDC001380]|uniref:PH domain-containing protein n=1 Tax=Streptomyces sp. NPDC001380 TaxID=3364566 RepID=UPI00369C07EA
MPATPPPADHDRGTGHDRTAGLPALPVTWRASRTRAVLLPVAVLLVVMFAAMAAALPSNWHAYDRGALVVTGLLFAAALVMLSRPRVTADPAGVTVVNFVRSRRLAWAEIVRVNLRQGDPWAVLDLADGTTLATVGIQPAAGREQAVAAARALRDLVDAHGAAAPGR